MKIFIGILSLLVSCAYCTHIPAIGLVAQHSDITLATFLLAQSEAAALDSAVSTQCFDVYLSKLEDVAKKWSVDYNACTEVANGNSTELMNQMKQEQQGMSNEADVVSSFISNCQAIVNSLHFFNCFANLGENTFSPVYNISNNASDFADKINQQMTIIDNEMYKCTNASKRVSVEQTANAYDELDYCLKNGPSPATDAPATDTPTTDTPTTDVPATEAPTTEAPTTEAQATDAPATDTPATEASTEIPKKLKQFFIRLK